MTVTFEEYMNELKKFSEKHNKKAELKVYTSALVNDRYHKEYCWSDGHVFYEVNELVEEIIEAEAHGLKVRVPVKFWRTEYWTTENSSSKYVYERA